ncbi:hypothetical protein M2480_002028 [Parabacteroides sp. PFB2-12]|uniref:hypothetical protein n=1 Tax=unclassified Parabacteroides TaxID=2649774 RepID=UPI002476349B|nr:MULTISPECIES: hypothetical protein [unclassified Parabacteroides]MDH6342946.1 hypothetical protein [Parabacteroides sp. PM6-13]MDH6391039.1 hypothetical protein [Parabacteroides sp. PFB2-12]
MKRILCLLFCLLLVTACEREKTPPFDHPIMGIWDAKEYYIPYDGRTIQGSGEGFSFDEYWNVIQVASNGRFIYSSKFELIDDKYLFLNFNGKYKFDGNLEGGSCYLEILEFTQDSLKLYEHWDNPLQTRIWTLYLPVFLLCIITTSVSRLITSLGNPSF